MTDEQQGGAGRELGNAVTRMVQAIVHGDAVEAELAMSDYAAALGSAATSSMAAIAAPLMAGIIALDKRIEQGDRARLERNSHFQHDMDTRFDVVVAGQDRIEQGMVARRQAVDEQLDDHEARITRIEQHLGLAGDDG